MRIFVERDFAYASYSKVLEKRGFGVKRGGRIILDPVEVLYLAIKGNAKVVWRGRVLSVPEIFEWAVRVKEDVIPYYYAYEDLRRRGYRVKPVEDYLVAGKVFLPLSESKVVTVREIAERRVENLILAVVDEENDVTYYRVEEVDPKGAHFERLEETRGHLVRDRILSDDVRLFERYFYGSLKDGVVCLSLLEGVYLSEIGALRVEGYDIEDLREVARRFDPNFDRRYEVYKDLKLRNFVVKTGFKFGSDFRVYERVESVRDLPHSKYLVTVVDDKPMPTFEVARAVRLAQNVRKKHLFVYKDEKGKNRFVLVERIKV